jgi:NAD(P)-dependent dehydrogenase (short-subunit alcohol dehydrogenase family)/acyl dehydratase/putative sterol carrier protein
MGLLDGTVVLVTGAGGGIGRAHAIACAREGAKIVVNDLGGSRDGTGAGDTMAEQVASEIRAMGGEAVANHDSVTDADGCRRMVKAATDAWGRLDVVVNNAGILRDKTFAKMTDAEWFPVLDVHLNGTRNLCAAALDALTAQGGAIINTTSYSGMIGNFGQSNYAAAKAGIYGFSRVLALELRKAGVTVNCVAPVAKTRMTEDIGMVEADWKPEQISPIVVFLASPLGKGVTGQVFGVQGQRIHVYEVKTNDGVEKAGSDLWTAQEIAEKLSAITGFEAPKAAAPAGEDPLTKAFSYFPQGFKPGTVPGWKAVIQWKVAGGTDQTITVDGDACQVASGLVGSPTCTVKVDRDTLLAMLTGQTDPQKAFMSGKAQADNMGDLMKLAMAFDFKKAAAAYAAGNAAPAAAPSADVVSDVFAHFPAGFKAASVPGWTAVFHWVVAGGTSQTLSVKDGACTVAHTIEGAPTCTIKVGKDDLVAMFTGKLDPQKAFMGGKAAADNMGDLMKLAMAFDFKKVAASYEAAHGGAAAPAPAATAPAASAPAEKTLPIGKRYEGGFWQVTRDEFQAYARATDDPNPAYFGADAVAPPMVAVRAFHALLIKMSTDPDLNLDLLRLVHGEQDMRFFRVLRHGDILDVRGKLVSAEEKSSGQVVKFELYGFVDGQLAVEVKTSVFIRGKKKEGGAPAPAPEAPPARPEPDLVVEQPVTADQATRYAHASTDNNPIHLDEAVAKSGGLPGVILHGLCTMAFAQRDVIARLAGGDPAKLARLSVRFAKPVFPGQTLTLRAWRRGGTVEFETTNPDGVVVLSNAVAELR